MRELARCHNCVSKDQILCAVIKGKGRLRRPQPLRVLRQCARRSKAGRPVSSESSSITWSPVILTTPAIHGQRSFMSAGGRALLRKELLRLPAKLPLGSCCRRIILEAFFPPTEVVKINEIVNAYSKAEGSCGFSNLIKQRAGPSLQWVLPSFFEYTDAT